MKELKLNQPAITLTGGAKAQTERTAQGYNIFTAASTANYAVTSQITVGGKPYNKEIPKGAPILYPYVLNIDTNVVFVQNQNSVKADSMESGWFALSEKTDKHFTSGYQKIGQYQTISGQSGTSIQTLQLNSTDGTTLAFILVGDQEPIPVVFNLPSGFKMPASWSDFEKKVVRAKGNHYELQDNFYGKTVFVANLSLTKDASLQARLI